MFARSLRQFSALLAALTTLLMPLVAFAEEVAATAAGVAELGWMAKTDAWFGEFIVAPVADVLFWEIPGTGMPLIVAWLFLGALYFTLRMSFVNVRMFGHAIALVRGVYDDPNAKGEVTHFQALASALSATVGLGNIAGVAIAVGVGGPGATFWMILIGILGMTAKFAEVTLGQMYREVRPDGRIMGGAMEYLSKGLAEMNMPRLGKVLAVLFVILCIGGSLGGGNAFQVSQSVKIVASIVPVLHDQPWIYGAILTLLAGIVIVGGIRRIASVADKVVPAMCFVYVAACLYILGVSYEAIPAAFGTIIDQAFNPDAVYGGVIGVMVLGIKRAVFSNEAGTGSAAIAHSAAKVEFPVQEGIVALLEPFIDTIVICTMTALVIVITNSYDRSNPEILALIESKNGASLTLMAMTSVIPWFKWILAIAVTLFAFSTIISWSYYGERCWTWAFGDRSTMVYRLIFLTFTFLGSVVTADNINTFSELMILGMAFPNILGVVILSGKVKRALDDYRGRLKRGEVKRHA